MRVRNVIGWVAGIVAVPAMAASPGPGAPAARPFGNVPTLALQTATGQPVAARPGWGAGGWTGGAMRPGVHSGGARVTAPTGHHGGWVGGRSGYRRPFVGYVLPRQWYSPTYLISDWSGYGLSAPGGGRGWYRYYDDAVLVDAQGAVRDHRGGIDWTRGGAGDPDRAYDRGYDDGYEDGYDDGVDYAEDAVSYRGDWSRSKGARGGHGGVYHHSGTGMPAMSRPGYGYDHHARGYRAGPGTMVYDTPGGGRVVVVQSAPAVTTTTTTTYETVHRAKRVWSAPKKKAWRAKGKTLCRC